MWSFLLGDGSGWDCPCLCPHNQRLLHPRLPLQAAAEVLEEFGVPCEVTVVSAHRWGYHWILASCLEWRRRGSDD